ncbi:hypothetical protein BC829DRAFT_420244 [Chytridium lagenaria]|nr:hypothetical protein BC829DRAFT_420244 [Chytridium lagenaria]
MPLEEESSFPECDGVAALGGLVVSLVGSGRYEYQGEVLIKHSRICNWIAQSFGLTVDEKEDFWLDTEWGIWIKQTFRLILSTKLRWAKKGARTVSLRLPKKQGRRATCSLTVIGDRTKLKPLITFHGTQMADSGRGRGGRIAKECVS